MTTLHPNLPAIEDPKVLRCAWYCGYVYYPDFSGFTYIAWVDTWTPIQIGGGFDNANFSQDASDIAQLMNVARDAGENAISDQSWQQISSIMTAATSIDIPYPGTTPADDADKIERLGTWGR